MTFTPHITIYPEGGFNYGWLGDSSVRATLIFSKNLEYNKTLSRKRVNIHLGDEERIHTGSSIKSIWLKNTLNTTKELNDVDKINIFLKIIYHSVMTIAEKEGWVTASFEKAYQNSIADNGNFIWHSKLKSNKNRSLKARISVSLDKNGKVPISAEFFDMKTNQQFKIPIIDTFLHFVDWEKTFVKPVWIDNEKFGFSLINSQLKIYADTQFRESRTSISEKKWRREGIEGLLLQLTFRQFSNNKNL